MIFDHGRSCVMLVRELLLWHSNTSIEGPARGLDLEPPSGSARPLPLPVERRGSPTAVLSSSKALSPAITAYFHIGRGKISPKRQNNNFAIGERRKEEESGEHSVNNGSVAPERGVRFTRRRERTEDTHAATAKKYAHTYLGLLQVTELEILSA